jgi:hypothetical protein
MNLWAVVGTESVIFALQPATLTTTYITNCCFVGTIASFHLRAINVALYTSHAYGRVVHLIYYAKLTDTFRRNSTLHLRNYRYPRVQVKIQIKCVQIFRQIPNDMLQFLIISARNIREWEQSWVDSKSR